LGPSREAIAESGSVAPRATRNRRAALADAALEIGFMISFSGIATFPNAKDLIDIVKKVPSDRILIETDCPYLAPVPHRGKRNEPAFIADTAKFIAKTRDIELEQLLSETYCNYSQLFSLEDN